MNRNIKLMIALAGVQGAAALTLGPEPGEDASEEETCVICLGQGELYPMSNYFDGCTCKGTGGLIHDACMTRWRNSGTRPTTCPTWLTSSSIRWRLTASRMTAACGEVMLWDITLMMRKAIGKSWMASPHGIRIPLRSIGKRIIMTSTGVRLIRFAALADAMWGLF